jgi:hypothetical protein
MEADVRSSRRLVEMELLASRTEKERETIWGGRKIIALSQGQQVRAACPSDKNGMKIETYEKCITCH